MCSSHLSCHIVLPSQLIGKAISVRNEDKTEFLDRLLHDGNSCGTTDKSNIMNIALVDPAVTEAHLHGTHGISEIVHVQLLKVCFRQQEKSMSSKRESIS